MAYRAGAEQLGPMDEIRTALQRIAVLLGRIRCTTRQSRNGYGDDDAKCKQRKIHGGRPLVTELQHTQPVVARNPREATYGRAAFCTYGSIQEVEAPSGHHHRGTNMKHLVIVAHPRDDSLTMCLAHAYVEELAAQGHQHTLHDLYRLEFDPVLTKLEIAQAPTRIRSSGGAAGTAGHRVC